MKSNRSGLFAGILALSIVITAVACDKNKRNSRRLDADKWAVTELSAEGVAESDLPELLFKECDIYKESCRGTWITPAGGRAQFAWQFRNKGKEFEISNQTDHVHTIEDVKAGEQCIRYSGVYTALESKRKRLVIESAGTHGFPGKKVRIVFEKK